MNKYIVFKPFYPVILIIENNQLDFLPLLLNTSNTLKLFTYMNIIKKIAAMFSKKKAPAQKLHLPKQPAIRKVTVETIGIVDAIYSPRELTNWLSFRLHKKYKPSQVEVLDVAQQGHYAGTIFAVTEGDKVYWVQIGAHNIYASPKSSLATTKSKSFRLLLKDKDIKQIKAICHIKNNDIEVIDIVEERHVPPTDTDTERRIKCKDISFPCSLADAAEAIKFL